MIKLYLILAFFIINVWSVEVELNTKDINLVIEKIQDNITEDLVSNSITLKEAETQKKIINDEYQNLENAFENKKNSISRKITKIENDITNLRIDDKKQSLLTKAKEKELKEANIKRLNREINNLENTTSLQIKLKDIYQQGILIGYKIGETSNVENTLQDLQDNMTQKAPQLLKGSFVKSIETRNNNNNKLRYSLVSKGKVTNDDIKNKHLFYNGKAVCIKILYPKVFPYEKNDTEIISNNQQDFENIFYIRNEQDLDEALRFFKLKFNFDSPIDNILSLKKKIKEINKRNKTQLDDSFKILKIHKKVKDDNSNIIRDSKEEIKTDKEAITLLNTKIKDLQNDIIDLESQKSTLEKLIK
jgi:hypothetical protein